MREVARRAGVTQGTVSNAVNHPERLAPETLERVNAAMRELGFVPNHAARQLRTGASRVFGIVVIDVASPYFGLLEQAVQDAAEEAGYSVLLGNSGQQLRRQSRNIALFQSQRVAGLLVTPIGRDLTELARVQDSGTPVLLIDSVDPCGCFTSVAVDHRVGGRLAVKHLIEIGRRRIGVVSDPGGFPQTTDRVHSALAHIRRTAGVRGQRLHTAAMTFEGGLSVGGDIAALPQTERPDAVFAGNDLLAIGLIEALRAEQIRVPEEIAVVGYDDIPYAATSRIPLTTVRQPITVLARAAVEAMLRRLADPTSRDRILYTPELVVRGSSVTPAESA